MTSIPDGVTLAHHTSDKAPAFMDAMCYAYADAYGVVPGENIGVKTTAFRDRATKGLAGRNYDLVTAHANDRLGF